jgi:type IV secretory pathway VirB10-like protein
METRNPWKFTAIGMALVVVTALVTGLVIAKWYGPDVPRNEAQPAASPATGTGADLPPRTAMAPATTPSTPAPTPAAPAPTPAVSQPAETRPSGVPTRSVTEACNQYAARQTSAPATKKDKTIEVVKDAAVGAVGGAAVGALGGAIAGGGSGAGKGAAIGGVVGGGAGTLYGIYQNRQNDQAYRTAYSNCMRQRGYTS